MMSRDAKWLKSHRLFFFRPCPFAPGVIIIKRLSAVRIFFFRGDCGEISLPFLDPSSRDLGARGMGDPFPPSPIPPWSRLHPEKRKKIFLLFSYLSRRRKCGKWKWGGSFFFFHFIKVKMEVSLRSCQKSRKRKKEAPFALRNSSHKCMKSGGKMPF